MKGMSPGKKGAVTPRAYVAEQLAVIIGADVAVTDGQVSRFWEAFARTEEREAPTDQHGNFPYEASILAQEGLLECPPLHNEIEALQQQHPTAPPRWPHGRRFAACLTHDVDRIVQLPWRERWRQLALLHGKVPPCQAGRWLAATAVYAAQSACGRSDHATYDFWLAEEQRHGFHSTFFVLPEQPVHPTTFDHYYRYADPVCYRGHRMPFATATAHVHNEGWEIGVHGSYASANDVRIFRAEKAQLEEMLGAQVISARQHFLRFNVAVTPRVQAQSGIHADSTLGYSATIGCRAGLAFPYFWPDEPVLEAPLVIQDVGLLRTGGKRSDLPAALARARAVIECIANSGGLVTLSWHTHPESPGAHACYRALLETIAELGGWGCSLGELNAWWRARRESVLADRPAATERMRTV